jgi:Protein of unknown function (DUF3306)
VSERRFERNENGGFFDRWSQRKAQARGGQSLPAAPDPAVVPVPVAPLQSHAHMADQAAVRLPQDPAHDAAPPPPLTLDDVQALTPEADFSPFVARGVAPEVRNAALRKLFADPTFNVMDGLDIYIDDYSQPNPLPSSLARQLVSAQFMKLFDEPAVAPPSPADASASERSDDGDEGVAPIPETP